MAHSPYVVWFDEVDKGDISIVGGKGANLGEMTKAGIPVPTGFIVTAQAYFKFIKDAGIKEEITHELRKININNSKILQSGAKKIRDIINKADIPEEIVKDIFAYYHNLPKHLGKHKLTFKRLQKQFQEPLVAVRSSATAEDLPGASFAGQQETFLNVQGDANLIYTVRKAWASLFTARAIFYREEKKFDHMKVGIALPVQKMIESKTSGIMFTLDPITNNKEHVVIEAIYGLGELIVQGAVTPDHYIVNKHSLNIIAKHLGKQEERMVLKGKDNVIQKLKGSEGSMQKITDAQIKDIAKYGKQLEKHYYFPQDVEWAIEDDLIFILQTRPVTTSGGKKQKDNSATLNGLKELLTGSPASPGIGSGRVVIIKKASEINKVKSGDVLVSEMTDPDFVPAMRRASGVITDKGGRTSHAAIVSRELGIPAVVGTKNATKELHNNLTVTVDGSTGKVYEGSPTRGKVDLSSNEVRPVMKINTATNVYCNLATPDRVNEVAAMNVDGIGLLRAEFMIADIGYHPRYLIEQKKTKLFIDKMTEHIGDFCKHFGPDRPVVYRATDFKSNEYHDLKGGSFYEAKEENPMLGFRGAYRYISDPKVFQLELKVIKNLRNKLGYRNLWLMIPFVRTVEELKLVKRLIQEAGLHRSGSFKLWMMVELPSNVILIDDFIETGIDGVSIGSNDLTQLTLGVDRDSEKVSKEFNELNPAVLWSIERVVKSAVKHKITASICGQAASDYPDLVEKLVEWGATSVSVNPDAVDRTRELIYQCENRLIVKRSRS